MMSNSLNSKIGSSEMNSCFNDDQIDLGDVFAFIKRRLPWILGIALLGFAMGCLVASQKSPLVRQQILIDLSQGPRGLLSANISKNDLSPPLMVVNYEPNYSRQRAFALLQKVIQSIHVDKRIKQSFIIGEPSDANISSDQTLAVQAISPDTQVPIYRAGLDMIAQRFIAAVNQHKSHSSLPAESGFIQFLPPENIPRDTQKIIFLYGLGGLVLGIASGFLVDRLANKVFSESRLISILGHPLRSKLPSLPWDSQAVTAELEMLAHSLDLSAIWFVVSVAQPHPCIQPLVLSLRQLSPELQIFESVPLLVQNLQVLPEGQAKGLLVVVESGFNSLHALQDARRVLDQIYSPELCGLVLVGQLMPPELQG